MIVYKCDRCGKEIAHDDVKELHISRPAPPDQFRGQIGVIQGPSLQVKHYCPDCNEAVQQFIDGKLAPSMEAIGP